MRKVFIYLIILIFSIVLPVCTSPTEVYSGELITNEDVIKMVGVELGDDLIIAKIRASETDFDLSTDGLIALKSAGASKKLISVMFAEGEGGSASVGETSQSAYSSTTNAGGDAPWASVQNAAYGQPFVLLDGELVQMEYTHVEAKVSGNSVARNVVKQSFSFGFAGRSTQVWLHTPGQRSNSRVSATTPVFYIKGDSMAKTAVALGVALVGFNYHPGHDIRYVIANTSAWQAEFSSINENIAISIEKEGDGWFKITPQVPLFPGEYALLSMANRFFDFGVDAK